MKTIEIPNVGQVMSCAWAKNTYLLGRWVTSPLLAIGGIILGNAFYISFSNLNHSQSVDPLFLVLLVSAGGLLIGFGVLIRFVILKIVGGHFLPYDWFDIMNTFMGKGKNELAHMAAKNLVACSPNTIPEMLIVSTGHLILAEKHGEIDHWNKQLIILDNIIAKGFTNDDVQIDKAYALGKLSRHEDAIKIYDEIITSNPNPVTDVYAGKVENLIKLYYFDSAISFLDSIETSHSKLKNNEQIIEFVKAWRKNIENAKNFYPVIQYKKDNKYQVITTLSQIDIFFDRALFLVNDNIGNSDVVQKNIDKFEAECLPTLIALLKEFNISIAWINIGIRSEVTKYLSQKGMKKKGYFLIKNGNLIKYKEPVGLFNNAYGTKDTIQAATDFLNEKL